MQILHLAQQPSENNLVLVTVYVKGGAPIGAEGAMTPHLQQVGGLGEGQPIDKKLKKTFLEPHEKFVGFYAVVGTT